MAYTDSLYSVHHRRFTDTHRDKTRRVYLSCILFLTRRNDRARAIRLLWSFWVSGIIEIPASRFYISSHRSAKGFVFVEEVVLFSVRGLPRWTDVEKEIATGQATVEIRSVPSRGKISPP